MNISQLAPYLKENEEFMKNVTIWVTNDAKEGRYEPFPDTIDPRLAAYYKGRGITELYLHQKRSYDSVTAKKNTVVVTPTASGKTLCYNLPVIDHMLKNEKARALYLFPTKALAQDQMAEIAALVDAIGCDIRTFTFDGDTPATARKAVREAGNIVVSNPDMLHAGILPHHSIWTKLFENLSHIVIDELHTYRGVFGSHFANVIRRLKRICAFYGSNPTFVLCSATIANPKEHAENLTGAEVHLIDENGAPQSEKHLVVYNPPVVNKQLGIRSSSVKEAASIGTLILKNKIPCIIFARSRVRVEVLTNYLKERVKGAKIVSYRGGYLPNERRRIEHGLRHGEIEGVVSTNALELGIDIGMLDAVISAGYPGSISSLFQQFGRAGRRGTPSIAILVATSSPLDQYIASNPSFLITSSPERATINPDNLLVLMDHLKCAAFELPFSPDERFAAHLSTTKEMLDFLSQQGVLKFTGDRYHWMEQIYPANEISLRTASQENFVIVDTTRNNQVIGEIDYNAAPTLIHTDAIYLHQGQQFYVDKLDWDRRTAFVHAIDSDYYTDAQSKVDVHIIEDFDCRQFALPSSSADQTVRPAAALHRGEVNVREKAMMFKKIRFHTHENLGWGKIDLPESEMHSSAVWIDFEEDVLASFGGRENSGALLYALSYLFQNIAPVFTFCDVRDIHSMQMARSNYSGKPAVVIYDAIPGGAGIAERIFEILPMIADAALRAVEQCPCETGCPGCIGPMIDSEAPVKKLAAQLLRIFAVE